MYVQHLTSYRLDLNYEQQLLHRFHLDLSLSILTRSNSDLHPILSICESAISFYTGFYGWLRRQWDRSYGDNVAAIADPMSPHLDHGLITETRVTMETINGHEKGGGEVKRGRGNFLRRHIQEGGEALFKIENHSATRLPPSPKKPILLDCIN